MEYLCPNCGSHFVDLDDADHITGLQLVASIITFGLFDSWKRSRRRAVEAYDAGLSLPLCLACGWRFKSTDEIDRGRIAANADKRRQGEDRLQAERERNERVQKARESQFER